MKHSLPRLGLALVLSLLASPAGAQHLLPVSPSGQRGLVLTPPAALDKGRLEDIYVLPARAGQNRVPYWNFDWRTHDFGSSKGGSGVRLYFYERESAAAGYAVSAIGTAYDRLVDTFRYVPKTTIPFILYASYVEFQATNVFFIGEGTLGATDPRDLRMAMPFFGNVKQFERIATHEMAHQFTIQKVRDVAASAGLESPLMIMPLWFIEGLAEWGAFGGMDPEGDYILRDLITNADPAVGYALPDFFNDRAGGYIGVYKLGQARVTFLADEYGDAKVVELLERSTALAGMALAQRSGSTRPPSSVPETPPEPPAGAEALPDAGVPGVGDGSDAGGPDSAPTSIDGGAADAGTPSVADGSDAGSDAGTAARASKPIPRIPKSFADYVSMVVGESPEQINARYHHWLKRRYFTQYLGTAQNVADFAAVNGLDGEPDSFSVSEDGKLVVYRSIERETGVSRLFVQDLRDPGSRVLVARDQRPGIESLHPVDRRVTSLRAGRLLYTARAGERDEFFLQRVTATEKPRPKNAPALPNGERPEVSVRLSFSAPERFAAGEVLEVYDPALSPDGKQVAFAGVDLEGFRDLYLMQLEGPARGSLERLTRDVWFEADLAWDDGRLLFVSDQTESHEPNLFSFDLQSREKRRLTRHQEADRHPVPAFGGVLFVSHETGKPDLWLLEDGRQRRLTDTPNAQLGAAPLSESELLSLTFNRGRYQLYKVSREKFVDEIPVVYAGVGGSGLSVSQQLHYPRTDLPGSRPRYLPGESKNWRIDASAGAVVGPTSVGAAGIAVTDLLRDHMMLINVAVYGTLKLTDALLFYVNQARRPALGVGAFHTFESRRDKTFPTVTNFYLQREFGVAGMVRHPLDRFRRLEGSLEIRGIDRWAFTDYTGDLYAEWQRQNGGIEPELVVATQYGYDTMVLNALAGPVAGRSLVAGLSAGYLPVRDFGYARLQLDAQQRVHIFGRSSFLLRGAVGATTGGMYSPQFFLSSIGNMEGYHFGDARLLGDNYYVTNARVSLPLDALVTTPILTGIYGIAGLDFGATFDDWSHSWERRSLSAVLGTDLGLGPLLVQLHWGRLLDIGGVIPPNNWVFNLDLRYLYF